MAVEKDLIGKIALITGANSGIGAASAKLLAEHGATVIVVGNSNISEERKVAKELTDKGMDAYPKQVNLLDPSSIDALANNVIDSFGHVDILVNNGGIISRYDCEDLPLEQWNRVIDINLRGAHLMIQAFIGPMRENGGGKIVNISSLAGRIAGKRTSPDYASSKGGLMAMTRSYAAHYAIHNININSVAPGLIETPMTIGRNKAEEVPMGRLGTSEDIAKAVYFLSSELSDYITGITLDVNGGMFMI